MKPSQIQLTENRILVKIDEASDTTEAGIVVTEDAMELGEFQTGIVLSFYVEKSPLVVGNRVLFLHFAGKDIKLDYKSHKVP
ncbi:MAG: hypothetical protein V3W37_07730, partial [Candidatus Binatia bacterium]